MSTGFLSAVAAALLLGGYLVAVKQYFSHYPPTVFVSLTHIIGLVWYFPVIAVTIPIRDIVSGIGVRGAVILAGTAGCTALALFVFYKGLALGEVSYVAPISKIVPVFVLPLEVVFLDQQLSAIHVIGVGAATGAVYVANHRRGSLLDPLRRLRQSKAALLALASAAAFGVVDVGKRTSMQELNISPESFVLIMLILVPTLLAPSAVGHLDAVDWWSDRWRLLFAGLVFVIGQYLVASSFQTLPASVVSPVVNTQAVVAVVLGSILLGEEGMRIRFVAAALAICGIVLITIG